MTVLLRYCTKFVFYVVGLGATLGYALLISILVEKFTKDSVVYILSMGAILSCTAFAINKYCFSKPR